MPAEVKVYTTTICPYCIRAKALLKKRGIAYEEINVENDPAARVDTAERCPHDASGSL